MKDLGWNCFKFLSPEVEVLREDLEGIAVKGKNCPKPIKSWAHCGVSKKVMDALKRFFFLIFILWTFWTMMKSYLWIWTMVTFTTLHIHSKVHYKFRIALLTHSLPGWNPPLAQGLYEISAKINSPLSKKLIVRWKATKAWLRVYTSYFLCFR